VITARSSLVDVAYAVCTALDRAGYVAVMTGGSAATFHAPDAYQSKDLDFVITMRGERADDVLTALGYTLDGDYYVHRESTFPLEFLPGPLMVGDEQITEWATHRRRREVVYVLTPSDSCRDRLAAFLFWNDFSALEQALAVANAKRDDIDLAAIKRWCAREGKNEKFALFATRLGG
jgi:hypothetical protein